MGAAGGGAEGVEGVAGAGAEQGMVVAVATTEAAAGMTAVLVAARTARWMVVVRMAELGQAVPMPKTAPAQQQGRQLRPWWRL